MYSKFVFVCFLLCLSNCFALQNFQLPNTGSLQNATNILQQLLDQANNLENNGNGGGLGGLGGLGGSGNTNPITNNPIVDFFRNFLMFFINMFNTMIRLFTGGLVNGISSPLKSAEDSLKFKNADPADNEIAQSDDDLKELHAKAHGPECMCKQFNRANLPQFAGKDEQQVKKIAKRSVNSVLSADQVVDFLDAKVIQNLLDSFLRSEKNQQ